MLGHPARTRIPAITQRVVFNAGVVGMNRRIGCKSHGVMDRQAFYRLDSELAFAGDENLKLIGLVIVAGNHSVGALLNEKGNRFERRRKSLGCASGQAFCAPFDGINADIR